MNRFYLNPFAGFTRFQTVQMPLFDPDDTGGEGGAGGDGGTGGAGGDGGGEVYEFKDENQRFKFPGMATPMTVKEYNASVLPKAQYEGTISAVSALAKAINEGRRRPQARAEGGTGTAGATRETKPDPFAALEANELPTGKDLVAALRTIDTDRMTPLTKLVVAMAEKMKVLEGQSGSMVQEREERDFSGELNRSIESLKLPQAAGAHVLSEMARDLYLSFDDADRPKLKGETFQKIFAGRFEQTRKFFRELEKATAVQKQKELRGRAFARPGASTSTNGKPQPRMSNAQRAAALFASDSPT